MPPRSPKEVKEDRRRARMASAINTAMARDLPVVLSDASGNLLGEGRIVRKERSDAYGLYVFLDGQADPVPLPFIKKMALSERS